MTRESKPASDITFTADERSGWALREYTGLQKLLGPESYRLVRGLYTNPLSVAGLLIVGFFLLVAALAPVLAPPVRENADPLLIPRDGYGPEPKSPGAVWTREPPPIPFWYSSQRRVIW